jgi:hypothetical protein
MAQKRGRKPQGEYVGKSKVINFRITPLTLAALKEEARRQGRSLSQQTEHCLARDLFAQGSPDTRKVMGLLGYVIDGLTNFKNADATWLDDPYLFAQAKSAVGTLLNLLPVAGAKPPSSVDELGGRSQGAIAGHEFFRNIQIRADHQPRAKQAKRDRALLIHKSDLGEIAHHARPYGKSTEQSRWEAEAHISRELSRELAPLRRKHHKHKLGKGPALTLSERKKHNELMKRAGFTDDIEHGEN